MITFLKKKPARLSRGVAKPPYKTVKPYSCCIVADQFFYMFTFAKIRNNSLSHKDSRREIHNDHAISYVDTLSKPVNQVFILSFESVCTIIAKTHHD